MAEEHGHGQRWKAQFHGVLKGGEQFIFGAEPLWQRANPMLKIYQIKMQYILILKPFWMKIINLIQFSNLILRS